MYHARTKYIDVRYHWIRKAIEEQLFQIRKIYTDENTTDMMSKVITKKNWHDVSRTRACAPIKESRRFSPSFVCCMGLEGEIYRLQPHICCCNNNNSIRRNVLHVATTSPISCSYG